MSLIPVPIRSLDAGQDLQDRWVDWQARAAASDTARDKAATFAAVAVLLVVVLNGLLWLR
jgi:hypothetical protein